MSIDWVFTILGGACTVTFLYGLVKMNRMLILNALFYYSFLPIIGESMGYLQTKSTHHILFIGLFLCQLILTTLKFEKIDDTVTLFSKFAVRAIGCFIVINALAAGLVLGKIVQVSMIYGVYHLIIAVGLLGPLTKRLKLSRK